MISIKEVLLKISEGKTIAAIAKELDMREATLRAMIEFMVERGYLKEFESGGGCAGCPINRKCKEHALKGNLKIYALTGKGKEYIIGSLFIG